MPRNTPISKGDKVGGVIITTPLDGGRTQERDTVQCCHCGRHWIYRQGSGNVRGWCMRCNAITCGIGCEVCVPWEKLLENMEAGMPYHEAHVFQGTQISTAGLDLLGGFTGDTGATEPKPSA